MRGERTEGASSPESARISGPGIPDRPSSDKELFVGRQTDEIFGVLADLPVGVLARVPERGFDVGAVEGGEREDGASADGGLVAAPVQHGGQAGGVAERPERGDRGFAHERIRVTTRDRDESLDGSVVCVGALTECEGRRLCDPGIVVAQQRQERSEWDRRSEAGRGLGGASPNSGVAIRGGRRPAACRGIGRTGARECAQRSGAHTSVGVAGHQPLELGFVVGPQYSGPERRGGGGSVECRVRRIHGADGSEVVSSSPAASVTVVPAWQPGAMFTADTRHRLRS
jgi:hypothetical protein